MEYAYRTATWLVAVALTACSSPAMLLIDPGNVLLVDRAGNVEELTAGREIALRWDGENGREDSTTTAGRTELVPTTIIEANSTAIRLRSERWKKPEDLPPEYLASPLLNVALRSGRYDKPVVAIPTERVTRIVVYEKHRQPFGGPGYLQTGEWIWSGAAGGGLLLMGILADDLSNTEFSGGEALKLTLAGAAAGAVAYPIYKVLQPNYTLVGQSYPIGEGSYQLRVRRN